ncbi:MAG: amidase family protein, partial [Verrucomicrobia bacterium]|nr:amidase family protein [Verrucomicrobiota bacterium]
GLSVPCGTTATGLPVGLQVLGPAMKEANILRVGYAHEQAARDA